MEKMFIKEFATVLLPFHLHLQAVNAYKVNLSFMEGGGRGSTNLSFFTLLYLQNIYIYLHTKFSISSLHSS